MADPDIPAAIAQNAVGPAEVQGDAARVRNHPILDQIAADRYARAIATRTTKNLGLRFRRIIPPGAT